jgi:site-specific recombinase XerC
VGAGAEPGHPRSHGRHPHHSLGRTTPQNLSTKALRRLLRAGHNGGSPRDAAIIELQPGAVSAGLRVGELLQLQREDIALGDRAGWVIIRKGKHGHYPDVPLTRDVRQALADYLATDLPGEGEVPQRSL